MILTHFCETGLDSEKEDVELPKGLSALCHNHGLARPAALSPITDPLIQEWIDFRCQDLAEYYGKLAGYIRQLNPNVVVELNPHGISGANRAFLHGIDHVEGLQGLLEKADQWLRRLLRPPTWKCL